MLVGGCNLAFTISQIAVARHSLSYASAAAADSYPSSNRCLLDLRDVAGLISSGAARNVVVMVGAGVSVAAGIPDFRTPGTGLYDNLEDYGLPRPEAIFELNFFADNPKPFYRLCRELWPGQYSPTATHHFIRLLHEKGVLTRCYTQNIDSLESAAGLPAQKLVAAHGNFDSATVRRPNGETAPVPVEEVEVRLPPHNQGPLYQGPLYRGPLYQGPLYQGPLYRGPPCPPRRCSGVLTVV